MTFRIENSHLNTLPNDTLYHFGLSKSQIDFKQFKDIKFVCTGGCAARFQMYANEFSQKLGIPFPTNISLSHRFCIYKTGPVLWINHGMGVASMSIMLNETFKLLHYAGVNDVTFILEPGTVVISNGAVNVQLKESYDLDINGKTQSFKCEPDQDLAEELYNVASGFSFNVEKGKTLCANDFYEGQMKLDGALCSGSVDEQVEFLHRLKQIGVKNIEMECTGFASMTKRVGAKGAIVCVALINRMDGDQVILPAELYKDFEMRPFNIVTEYILGKITSFSK